MKKPRISHKAAKLYQDMHWGEPAQKVYQVNDDSIPNAVTQMGLLIEINCEAPDGQSFTIEFGRDCHLVFDPGKSRRLYNVLTDSMRAWCKQNLIVGDEPWYPLWEVARQAPGRQLKWSFPRIPVQCLGWATDVVYSTLKVGDGPSIYTHALGEDTNEPPLLCVDEQGRLFYAGGGSNVIKAGIVN